MTVLFVFLGVLIVVNAGYHEEIGIPLAAKLEAAEEKISAEEPKMEGRMAGGEVVNAGDYPFMVGLRLRVKKNSWFVCGSTVITNTHLLTAAHCLTDVKRVFAIFGSLYMLREGKRIRAATWKSHPQYDKNSHDHDIAVVTLKHSVKFSNLIQPVKLPAIRSEMGVVGQAAWALGWGMTTEAEDYVPKDTQLRVVPISIITELTCKKFYGKGYPTIPSLCVRGKVGVGPCSGDSGGPLLVVPYGQVVQVGVASTAHKRCAAGYPATYTQVFNHIDFIKEITGELE